MYKRRKSNRFRELFLKRRKIEALDRDNNVINLIESDSETITNEKSDDTTSKKSNSEYSVNEKSDDSNSGNNRTETSVNEEDEDIDSRNNDHVFMANEDDEHAELRTIRLKERKSHAFSSTAIPTSGADSSLIFMDVSILQNLLVGVAKCAECDEASLKIQIGDKKFGFAQDIRVVCEYCTNAGLEPVKSSVFTSKHLAGENKNEMSYEVNVRMTKGFLSMGKGYAGIQEFSIAMGMKPFTENTHRDLIKKVHEASQKALQKNFIEARQKVHDMYRKVPENADLPHDSPVKIAVSFDGSWHTRGHSSQHGVGCVIEVDTGFVIDAEVMSKYCQACAVAKSKWTEDSPEFRSWFEGHIPECSVNHTGSSGSMEMLSAQKLWERSEAYGLQYTTLLSDGDSKTFIHLKSIQPYGEHVFIEKEDCINHVRKNLGTGLRKIVKDCRTRGITLGGRGHGTLKEATIVKLTEYYYKAIRRNKGDVDGMRRDINATLLHCASTDEEHDHSQCPPGQSSWCFYQAAIAKETVPGSHKENIRTPISQKVLEYISPLYARLTQESLLQRCAKCRTQNANESLHSKIWAKCPKHQNTSKDRIEIAVAGAICEFNSGNERASKDLHDCLNLDFGKISLDVCRKIDHKRETVSEIRRTNDYARAQKIINAAKLQREQQIKAQEGDTYVAGGF